MEMEQEAAFLYTESAYFSENASHKVPNNSNSFIHSIIQTHIPQKIQTNRMNQPIFAIQEEEQKTMHLPQVIDEEDQFIQVTTETEDPVIGFKRRPKTPFKRSFLPESEQLDTEENQRLETNEIHDSFRAARTGQKQVHNSTYAVGKTNKKIYLGDENMTLDEMLHEEMEIHEMIESTVKSEANVVEEDEYLEEGNDAE